MLVKNFSYEFLLSTHIIKRVYHIIVTICLLVPPIGIPERIGGLPLGKTRTVVAEEEGVAEAGDLGLAGEELLRG